MRVTGWEQQLEQFLAQRARRRFAWCRNDCAQLALGAIRAITGRDLGPHAVYRGRKGAARFLRTFAGAGLLAAARRVARENGFAEVAPGLAQRGDVAACMTAKGVVLAVVGLDGQLRVFDQGGRLAAVPVTRAFTAWRVA